MRISLALGSFASLSLLASLGCSSADDVTPPDAGTFDAGTFDAASDVATDVVAEDHAAEAEACAPTAYDCQRLFVEPPVDAGAGDDAQAPAMPGVVLDANAGTVTLTLASGAPAIASATATVSYISTSDWTQCVTPAFGDVTLHATGSTLVAQLPGDGGALPEDFAGWCGSVHLTDGCGVVTDVPFFDATLPDLDLGGVQCAGPCGPDQWKAAVTGICGACPLPATLQCADVQNPTSTGMDFTFGAGANGPVFSAPTMTFAYMTNADDAACSGSVSVALSAAAGGTFAGTMPAHPADWFAWCRGNLHFTTGCAQSFDVELVVYDNGTTVDWGTACSD